MATDNAGTHRHGITGQYIAGPSAPNATITHHHGGDPVGMAASFRRATLHGTPGHQRIAPGVGSPRPA